MRGDQRGLCPTDPCGMGVLGSVLPREGSLPYEMFSSVHIFLRSGARARVPYICAKMEVVDRGGLRNVVIHPKVALTGGVGTLYCNYSGSSNNLKWLQVENDQSEGRQLDYGNKWDGDEEGVLCPLDHSD